METKFKVELDGKIVRLYYWRKIFLWWGQWIPFKNTAFGSAYDAYIEYEKNIKTIYPLADKNKIWSSK